MAARLFLVGVFMVLIGLPQLAAADAEGRSFNVFIDKSKSGDYQMEINRHDDGSIVVSTQANIRITFLGVPVYTYMYIGMEKWKEGKLHRLESSTNDDGKQFRVHGVADGTTLQVKVNDDERTIQQVAWLTTYWHLPDAKVRDQQLSILDADTGRELTGKLQHVGNEQINFCGQRQNCAHYRLSGSVNVDLWYDAQERLVRQEYVEDKHRVVHELASIRH